MLDELGIVPLSMEKQIFDTAFGLRLSKKA
jgi:hypothetical protein